MVNELRDNSLDYEPHARHSTKKYNTVNNADNSYAQNSVLEQN